MSCVSFICVVYDTRPRFFALLKRCYYCYRKKYTLTRWL